MEAADMAERAVQDLPACAALQNVLGVMRAGVGDYAAAVAAYRAALALPDAQPAVWTNLGNALTRLHHFESAIACHDRAIASAPNDGGFHYNRGISLAGAGRHDDAVAAFSLAMRLDPAHPMARWDRARSALHLGNLQSGWADYEVRLEHGLIAPRAPGGPDLGERWDGSPFVGRRLVLLAEQGFGDMIWAHRYLSAVCARGGEVVIEAPGELASLVAAAGMAGRVVVQGGVLPACDLHIHQCSLAGLFSPDLSSLAPAAYVRPNPARIVKFAARIGQGAALRVGIVWSGSTSFQGNADRAQPLARFITAFDMPGVALYSLQKGAPGAELEVFADRIIDLGPFLHDFADTAAAIACLDLVIMCDSAVAHLAGAIGREVWLLLGPDAHWLWLQDRNDSPWYPSMRLFRPRQRNDWDHVFDQAAMRLMQRATR